MSYSKLGSYKNFSALSFVKNIIFEHLLIHFIAPASLYLQLRKFPENSLNYGMAACDICKLFDQALDRKYAEPK